MPYAKDLLNKIAAIKNTDENDLLLDKTKGTLTGTLIGAGIGILFAYNHKKSLLMGAVIGGTLLGLTTKFLVNKK